MGMLWPTLEFILGVSMIITLLAGGHLVLSRIASTWANFVAFNTYMIHAHLAHHRRGLGHQPLPARHRVGKAHRRVAARPSPPSTTAPPIPQFPPDAVLRGEIEFRHLNFSYGETPVCATSRCSIPAGSSLAIVGPTGSGKSTLVNLHLRVSMKRRRARC